MQKLIKKIYKINYIYNKIFKENFKKKLEFDWTNKLTRSEIINKIIKKKNYKTYLEIGCFEDENFNKIKIEKKIGVDPVSGGTVRSTSDEFFLSNKFFFDIIFIDGLHIYEQVKKDIQNSLKFLNSDGIILLHDCAPLKIRDQMVPRSHEAWYGDTWKAIVESRTLKELDTYTLLADNGIGIILKNKNKKILNLNIKNFKKLKFKDYYYNFTDFMNPIEVDEFLLSFD